MQNLVDALPKAKVAAHAQTSAELSRRGLRRDPPRRRVMVKGSLSMKMALIVKALKERSGASPTAARAERMIDVNLVG